ncbi:MAG: molybdopterin-dependent oxidoreductase [Chloroflexota bacterium]|nr:molybdopterin-dependent oxidoreductase [Chloroflexota bacterium]
MNWRDINRRYEAGVWAVPLALFPAFLLSAAFGQPSCIEPIIEIVYAYTPVSFANVVLNLFGPFARPLALVGAIALIMPLGGLLGIGAPPLSDPKLHFREGLRWVSVTAAAIGFGIWLGSAATTSVSAMTAVLAGILFSPILLWTRTWRRSKARSIGRRKVIGALLGTPLVTIGILALSTYEVWSTLAVQVFSLGNKVHQIFPFSSPRSRQPGFPVADLEPEVTPIPLFYVNSKNTTEPLQLAENWTLRITGLVHDPVTLTYSQLLALPRTDLYATLRCVDNPIDGHLMSTALWSGVRISTLLSLVKPLANASTIVFHAADQFDEPFTLAELSPDGAILAYAMNGETLAQSHGAPVRALLPGWYGFRNIKWLQELELTMRHTGGYWERTGWVAGKVHPVARIDVVQAVDNSSFLVAGVAFGGLRGVSEVQVRIDAGLWQNTELNIPPLSPYAWIQWRVVLSVTARQFHLTARLIDRDGIPQDEHAQPVYPGGSSGLHMIEVKR